MKSKKYFLGMAILFGMLVGILPASSADNNPVGSLSNSEPKPLIVDWQSIASGDYQTYISNLQAMKCPKETIESIVKADAITAYASKRAEAVAVCYQNFQYWQSDPAVTQARAKLAEQRRLIDEEMNRAIQNLLNTDADLPDTSRGWQREEWNHELAFLTPEKREATKVILIEYAKETLQIRELAGGFRLTEDTNALQQILGRYKEKQSALQQVLLPEEYKLVDMTTSWTAENLRHAMVRFEPTKEEFRIIFEAWQPHDDRLSNIHATGQHDPGNLAEEAYAKIKEKLSASRYEKYRATWWK